MPERYALILGSGFTDYLPEGKVHELHTDYGAPSAGIIDVEIGGQSVLTLARHGPDHSIPAHLINYRANIAALKALGVTSIVALNTVGVIGDICKAGQLGLPSQVIDYTWGREQTFFTGGAAGVKHLDFTEPFPAGLRARLLEAARRARIDCYDGGVYAATQGPRLETAAEVDRLQRDGAHYIGMTAMPEAVLAAELDIEYACIALVVNQAAGRGDKPIHYDVAASTETARAAALALVAEFFGSTVA